jgi:hypothetical protein
MRWIMLILNLLAAAFIMFNAYGLRGAGVTQGARVYRELAANHAFVEKPVRSNGEPLDVEARLRGLGSGSRGYTALGFLGAGACIANGVIFFFSHRRRKPSPPNNSLQATAAAPASCD